MIIVGHGPSMLEHPWGELIDSHDIVIRQKRCSETLKDPEHFGSLTDYVCGSLTIAQQLPVDMPLCQYWAFVDSRHKNVPADIVDQIAKLVPCRILKDVCDTWNGVYRKARKPYTKPDGMREFDKLGHPHLSAGFHTILYACELWRTLHNSQNPDLRENIGKQKKITLVGFDNLMSGTFTWSVTRGPDYDQYPDHRWDIEYRMLDLVRKFYKAKITKAEVPDALRNVI